MPAENGESFRLTLDGPGIAVNKTVDRIVALSVIRVLIGDDVGQQRCIDTGRTGEIAPPPLSLREYLDSVSAKTKVAQIVAIAAYISDFSDQKDVGREEIRVRFSEAAEPMPANFPRDFGKVLKAAWMAPTRTNKGRFYVTQSGRAALKRGIKE